MTENKPLIAWFRWGYLLVNQKNLYSWLLFKIEGNFHLVVIKQKIEWSFQVLLTGHTIWPESWDTSNNEYFRAHNFKLCLILISGKECKTHTSFRDSDLSCLSASRSHHPWPSSQHWNRKTGSRVIFQCCISSSLRYLAESSDVEWWPTRYVSACTSPHQVLLQFLRCTLKFCICI